jgi:ArsR family transcriptional regulator
VRKREAERLLDPDRVAVARAALPDEATVFHVTKSLHLLGEAARLRIVIALLAAGELSVGDLAATIGLAEPATSQHLRILRAERMVRSRRQGRTVFYALDDDHVRELVEVALAHHRHV